MSYRWKNPQPKLAQNQISTGHCIEHTITPHKTFLACQRFRSPPTILGQHQHSVRRHSDRMVMPHRTLRCVSQQCPRGLCPVGSVNDAVADWTVRSNTRSWNCTTSERDLTSTSRCGKRRCVDHSSSSRIQRRRARLPTHKLSCTVCGAKMRVIPRITART